jgi:hypothetical protein
MTPEISNLSNSSNLSVFEIQELPRLQLDIRNFINSLQFSLSADFVSPRPQRARAFCFRFSKAAPNQLVRCEQSCSQITKTTHHENNAARTHAPRHPHRRSQPQAGGSLSKMPRPSNQPNPFQRGASTAVHSNGFFLIRFRTDYYKSSILNQSGSAHPKILNIYEK